MRVSRHAGCRCLALLALLMGAMSCTAETPTASAAIAPAELAERLAGGSAPLILDVRTPEEFASGHIPGAVNVPQDQLAERISSLDLAPDTEIVVHCERGGRARASASVLADAGYTRVRDLSGHMQVWRAKSLPVE